MEEKTAFGSNELYSCHALQLKRIYISAFILLLVAISYIIIMVDKRQSPIPLVTEPGLSYSVSGSNSGYMKAGNRPLLAGRPVHPQFNFRSLLVAYQTAV